MKFKTTEQKAEESWKRHNSEATEAHIEHDNALHEIESANYKAVNAAQDVFEAAEAVAEEAFKEAMTQVEAKRAEAATATQLEDRVKFTSEAEVLKAVAWEAYDRAIRVATKANTEAVMEAERIMREAKERADTVHYEKLDKSHKAYEKRRF